MPIVKIFNAKKNIIDSLEYITNPEKTDNGYWYFSNSGRGPEEAYATFVKTKKHYRKTVGRPAYHLVVSFDPEKDIDKHTAFEYLKEFAETYLGDNYEYFLSMHTDQGHLHGHIIFNSVSYRTGKKYHYAKGDWKRIIQPLADRLMDKYNLEGERFSRTQDEKTAERKLYPKYRAEVASIIDEAILLAKDYDDFLEIMKTKYSVKIRSGSSRIHGKYLAMQLPGKKTAIRSYTIPPGYSPAEINRKIRMKYDTSYNPTFIDLRDNPKQFGNIYLGSTFVAWKDMNIYQKAATRKIMEAKKLYGANVIMSDKQLQLETRRLNRMMNDISKGVKVISKEGMPTQEYLDSLTERIAELEAKLQKCDRRVKVYKVKFYDGKSAFELLQDYSFILKSGIKNDQDLLTLKEIEKKINVKEVAEVYNTYVEEEYLLKDEIKTNKREMSKYVDKQGNRKFVHEHNDNQR